MIMPSDDRPSRSSARAIQVQLDPSNEQDGVRRIIAQQWLRKNDPQEIGKRPLILWLLLDKINMVQNALVAIDGTPWRGMVLVPMQDAPAVRTSSKSKVLSDEKTQVLRDFVTNVVRQCLPDRRGNG